MSTNTTPSVEQLKQVIAGLERCHTFDSKAEFLRTWIRDWMEHKTLSAAQAQAVPVGKIVRNRYGGNATEWLDAQQAATMPEGAMLYTEPPRAQAQEVAPAAQASSADALDAKRWRHFLSTRPQSTHAVICEAIDADIATHEASK